MFLFCKHDWVTVTDTKLSQIPDEILKNATSIQSVSPLTVKHIVILKCTKCGKIYKSVEKIGFGD